MDPHMPFTQIFYFITWAFDIEIYLNVGPNMYFLGQGFDLIHIWKGIIALIRYMIYDYWNIYESCVAANNNICNHCGVNPPPLIHYQTEISCHMVRYRLLGPKAIINMITAGPVSCTWAELCYNWCNMAVLQSCFNYWKHSHFGTMFRFCYQQNHLHNLCS